ncbi:MAG TPA: hypothetical protein PK629_10250 [Oscillospiraceae bacterium]|nr:hypothetical protein [Oscillospiraceae bacterium]HPK36304.1 hypothetical protein [Oscillospiraceae bacterium]HPR76076.1 hypothetical protein [Oscillospiraceae bacterium]
MIYRSSKQAKIQWEVSIDLENDLENVCEKYLNLLGVSHESKQDCVITYLKYQMRVISQIPRKVLYSKEFKCPAGYEQILDQIVYKIEKGCSLKEYQSKMIANADYNDTLFNQWKIQHLHLGQGYDKDGFINRSDYLLFALFEDEYAYLINIYPHKDNLVFYHKELLEIIDFNWPQFTKNSFEGKLYTGNSSGFIIGDEDRKELWKSNISTPTQLSNDRLFLSINGGSSSDWTSTSAILDSIKSRKYIKECQKRIISCLDSIIMQVYKDIEYKQKVILKLNMLDFDKFKMKLYDSINKVILFIDFNNASQTKWASRIIQYPEDF